MNRTVKIALIIAGVIGLGVGGYLLYDRSRRRSGNKTKDDRKIKFVKS
jgi:hypothetical protein